MSRIRITDLEPGIEELDNKKMKGIFGGIGINDAANIRNSLFSVCTDAMGGHSVRKVIYDPSISMQDTSYGIGDTPKLVVGK